MKILVVEDNISIVDFLQKALEEQGYAVDIANDGKEGFYLATTNSYDIILLDIMLPYINGIDLCKDLRANKINTPILMLTAKEESEDIISGLDSGADDYMTKPFILNELLARIRVLLRRSFNACNNILKFKDLKLDLVKKTLTRDTKDIELTAKEFAIIELLVKNQDSIVSESMIIESVWDMNYANASNLVKVYIYRLRKKINKGFQERYINNIKNFGYSLR